MSYQLQSLRDALDHVTKEKRGLEVLCRQLKLKVDTLKEREEVRELQHTTEHPVCALCFCSQGMWWSHACHVHAD